MSIYSDVNSKSPTDKSTVEDLESVNQSIRSILGTRRTERFFNPNFGSEYEDILFEKMDDMTAARLFNVIVEAVQRHDPRIELDQANTDVYPNYDQNRYEVILSYSVAGLSKEKFQYEGFIPRPSEGV